MLSTRTNSWTYIYFYVYGPRLGRPTETKQKLNIAHNWKIVIKLYETFIYDGTSYLNIVSHNFKQ